MDDQLIGRVIDGRYVVEAMLGKGGMGVVVRARHQFTNAQVALKMLHRDLLVHEDVQKRFLAEAKTPSTIGHPGIVQVLDGGRTPEGELYLVMELLSGRTLRRAMTPPPPPQVTRRIMLELLDALAAAHGRGVIHRDLKPDNVFLCEPHGAVKLLDFGIAKIIETSTRAGGFTAAGAVLGTLQYMAPEQLIDASTVDHRTDLWAVGVMMYELVSGTLPYRGTQLAEIMTALASRDPDPITMHVRVEPAVEAFFARALSRDRNRRFASAQDMAAAVAAIGGEALAAVPGGTLATGFGLPSRAIAHETAPASVAVPIGARPHAPSQPPPMSMPHAPSQPPPVYTPPAATAPSGSRLSLWIALGVAALAMLAMVLVLAMRTSDAPVVADAPEDIDEEDDDDVVIPADADSSPGPVLEQTCVDGCQQIASCGYGTDTCKTLCRGNQLFRGCLANPDCEAFSRCFIGMGCPSGPSGVRSCKATLTCVQECKFDVACICGCAGAMASGKARLLTQYLFCAMDCGNAEPCLSQNCARIGEACKAN
jgi:hypothetical protein